MPDPTRPAEDLAVVVPVAAALPEAPLATIPVAVVLEATAAPTGAAIVGWSVQFEGEAVGQLEAVQMDCAEGEGLGLLWESV